MRAARLRVTGRVQGVGYRAWVLARAASLGIRGWVRNRRDGSVEALVIGADEAVEAMIDACRQGPFGARVAAVEIGDAEDDGSMVFDARPTV